MANCRQSFQVGGCDQTYDAGKVVTGWKAARILTWGRLIVGSTLGFHTHKQVEDLAILAFLFVPTGGALGQRRVAYKVKLDCRQCSGMFMVVCLVCLQLPS